jgi:cell division septum initiation protein DivIVA
VLWQSLADRAKGWADLLRDAAAKEQRIIDLEREHKEVREAAAADKKKLEDDLAEERRKVVEATAQFNTAATGRLIFVLMIPLKRRSLTVVSRRLP